jgi:hypothetical protein
MSRIANGSSSDERSGRAFERGAACAQDIAGNAPGIPRDSPGGSPEYPRWAGGIHRGAHTDSGSDTPGVHPRVPQGFPRRCPGGVRGAVVMKELSTETKRRVDRERLCFDALVTFGHLSMKGRMGRDFSKWLRLAATVLISVSIPGVCSCRGLDL